jgi:uncharacterized protein YjiS (DUF1127 family)
VALPSLFRRTRPDEASPPPTAPSLPRRAAPPPGELRRDRRALLRLREERIRDLGGLVLEMFRQDSFREHVLYEQCAEVAGIEERLHEIEALLQVRRPPAARCACGAPLFWGARFCGSCGRPAGLAEAPCHSCGHALAADAQFCPACGAPTETTQAG